jgi:opacity protein-like surface antigen
MKVQRAAIALVLVLGLCGAAHGGDFYLGLGAAWNHENFDLDGGRADFEDTYGVNLRVGYAFNPRLALELNGDWAEFDLDGYDIGDRGGLQVDVDGDVEVMTLIPTLKLMFPAGALRPYAHFGIGWMQADASLRAASALGGSFLTTDGQVDDDDLASKAGGGIDLFLNENISLMGEYNYFWGWDTLDEVRYHNVTAGIALHF